MLSKLIITFLTGLHLLKPIPTPRAVPVSQKLISNASAVSVPDEVYADLALQHELDHVSVYYFDSKSSDTVSINSDKNWDPASTIKLYVAMYAFDQVSHGKISLDQIITVDPKNVVPSQSFANGYQTLTAGQSVSIFELLDRMITQSGNVSYNTLIDVLGRQEITKYVHDLGLTNSAVGAKLNLDPDQETLDATVPGFGPNLVTASDYATAFILINGGRIPGSTDLFNMLARQKFNTMIPALLPKSVVVAHKTGELDPYEHDGGIIVDSNRRYVLSVFSDLGDPGIVAHISDLIYTNNVNLVGINQSSKPISEIPNTPIDPMVTEGTETGVLAASTQNINVPKVTASDIGIHANDLANVIDKKQLPKVIIPVTSPLHFLVDLGEQIRVISNPVPALRVSFQAENLKLKLAEANDLIGKGQRVAANDILKSVDSSLATIAKDPAVTGNAGLQSSIDSVSETRFSIFGSEIASSKDADAKTELIKEVASQAVNTFQNVKPYVTEGVKITNLSQTPVVGEVVKTTQNSVTVKTSDGSEVTTNLGNETKTRDAGSADSQITNPNQIAVGSTVAVAGDFVLTNIASESANPKPVTVLKVNLDTNSIIIQGANGMPQQIDLTPDSVIKGTDTAISLDQVNPGNVIVVHGEPMPATPSATTGSSSPSPTGTPAPAGQTPTSGSGSSGSGGSTATAVPGAAPSPVPTIKPSFTAAPTGTPKATSIPTPTPTVIVGNVIQVVQTPTTTPKPTTAPKTPAPTAAPKTPAPTPTPAIKR